MHMTRVICFLAHSSYTIAISGKRLAVSVLLHYEEQHRSKHAPAFSAFSLLLALDNIFCEQEHDNKSTNGL